jgi:hypothetical protein
MQRSGGDDENEIIFVIEACQKSGQAEYHTRINEAKYIEYFNKVSSAIVERIPNAIVMRNQIPKSYLHHDLYCNLIPNEDENLPFFQQVPRTYAFEVSYKGLLIFSKLQNKKWPNSELVAEKCEGIIKSHA